MPDALPDVVDARLHIEHPALRHGLKLRVDAVPQASGPVKGTLYHEYIRPGLVRRFLNGPGKEMQVVEAVFIHLHRQIHRLIQYKSNPLRLCFRHNPQGQRADVHSVHRVKFRECDFYLHFAAEIEIDHGGTAHIMHIHLHPVDLQFLPVLRSHVADTQAVIRLQYCPPGNGVDT